MNDFVKQAVKRVEDYLPNYESDVPAEILADIMHYCRVKGFNFAAELKLAEGYVDEEVGFMREYHND